MRSTNFPCSLCGSRDWPRKDAECELCEGEEDEGGEPDRDYEYYKDLEEE